MSHAHDDLDDDPFAALAATPIPPVPRDFGVRVHDGINRVLTTEHLCEGLLTDLPKAGWELFQAILGGAAWSLESNRRAQPTHTATRTDQSTTSRS